MTDHERLAGWLTARGLDGASETDLLHGFCAECRSAGIAPSRAMSSSTRCTRSTRDARSAGAATGSRRARSSSTARPARGRRRPTAADRVGEVFYGNIGSNDRVDFTVVEPAEVAN